MRITRKVMYEKIGSLELNLGTAQIAANVSHSDALLRSVGFAGDICDFAYPDYDWCALDGVPSDHFDLVVADQVLEHVKYPQKAFDESYRILGSGGQAIITSCFMNPLHPSPNDYWRFSEEGLQHLAEDSNFTVVEIGSWGNRVITPVAMSRTRWRGQWNDVLVSILRRFDTSNLAISNWIIVKK